MTKPTLHLCDFDGTLTRGDSFVRFLIFAVPLPRLALGGIVLLFHFSVLFLKGKWSNEAGKTAVLSYFFKGKTLEEMQALGEHFCQQKLPTLLRLELLALLRQARRDGHKVVIVSASVDTWLRPFCETEGFDLLCTALEFLANENKATPLSGHPPLPEVLRFSGHLATPNCNGAEKVRRIQGAYALHSFERIVAYGNSKGDAAMFGLAEEVFKF